MGVKTKFCLFLALVCMITCTNATMKLTIKPKPFHNLVSRLDVEASGGLVECWNALTELKSCTNEVVLFFINGEAQIGPNCCQAILTITRHCWPSMLTSLGFTAEEGSVLDGYCNASVSPVAAPAPSVTGA